MKDEEFPSGGLGVRVCVYYGTQITQTKAQMTADFYLASRTKLKWLSVRSCVPLPYYTFSFRPMLCIYSGIHAYDRFRL